MPLLRLRILHARAAVFLALLPMAERDLRAWLRTPAGRRRLLRGLARHVGELVALFGLAQLVDSLPDSARHAIGALSFGLILGTAIPRISRLVLK